MAKRGTLNERQERFCNEYLVDLNGSAAAIRSGYSAHTSREIAYELLTKPHIKERLQQLREEYAAKTGITPARVLKELSRIAFADPRKVMSWGPDGVKLIDSDSLTEDEAATVSEASETITKDGGSVRIKMHDKLSAIDKIGRHLGMFVDKHDLTTNGESINLIVASVTDKP